jgi:quercetin dioxygenase-like cupin family protein
MRMANGKIVKEFEVHPYVQFMTDRYSAYDAWVKAQGLPVLSGSYVADTKTVELGDWDWKGGKGAILQFDDQRVCDAYIAEIPAGGYLRPHRQLYEEVILIVSGQGSTSVWNDESQKRTFEWKRGSLFSVPLNAWHQHYNASGREPARYLALTTAPPIFELYRDQDFIFGTDHVFSDRFDGSEADFFERPGKYLTEYYGGVLDTNFISDIRAIKLVPREARGKGNHNMYIHLAGSTMFAHVSQFPVGTFKKAHRHGPGAHVCMLDSSGYTMMWHEGEEPQRYDWAEGSVLSPPAGIWHQHYNTGPEPCKFVALHASVAIQPEKGGIEQLEPTSAAHEYLMEVYRAECEKNGVPVNM